MFNALKYTKKFEELGFSKEQAQEQVSMVIEMFNENTATKQDFEKLHLSQQISRNDMGKMEVSLRSDMEKMETSLRSDMEKMETSLRSDMEKMETSLRSDMEKMETSLREEMKKFVTKEEFNFKLREEISRVEYQLKSLESRLTIKLGVMLAISVGLISTIQNIMK